MIIKVVGKRHVTFDGSDGKPVVGDTYYYLYNDDNVEGYCPDKQFVRSDRACPFRVNGEYKVNYNRHGKIDLDSVESI